MALKNRILGLTAAVLVLAPAAAFADDRIRYDVNGRYDGAGIDFGIHIHTSACRHDAQPPAPRPQPQPAGRYELQTVQRWEPGYTERVYVAEECTTVEKHKHKKKKGKGKGWGNHKHEYKTVTTTTCTPAHYVDRVSEGRYVNEQQWVWVPAHGHSHRIVARR